MQHIQNKQFQQTSATEYPAPQAIYVTSGGGAIIVIGNLMMAGVIIWSTSQNGQAAPIGILAGAACFGLITPVSLMALNGGIAQCIRAVAEIIRFWQEQVTARQQIHYQALQVEREQAERWRVVDSQPQTLREPPAPSLPAPTTFVPAQPPADDRLKLSCHEFVTALYLDDGSINPKRVLGAQTKRPFQVQYAKPGKGVMEYLYSLHMIWLGEGGMLFYDAERYPTLRDATNAISRGIPRGVEGIPPSPSILIPPLVSGEGGAR